MKVIWQDKIAVNEHIAGVTYRRGLEKGKKRR
jgi:hypothetical protein